MGAVEAVFRVNRAVWTATKRRRRLWMRSNSRGRSAANVGHHYDLGNDFYRLWLDRRMVYTCAYYATPEMSLDEAQEAKLDLVCRKLRLRAGERVVEAGSGWGALALHMARHYGVSVRSFNLSHEQVAYAREWARKDSLDDRVEFVEDDYRNVSGRYDAFVSVGMLEHVGPAHYEALGEVIDRSLPPDRGRGLLHFIGRDSAGDAQPVDPQAGVPGRLSAHGVRGLGGDPGAAGPVHPRRREPAAALRADVRPTG